MSEAQNTDQNAQTAEPQFAIQRIYVKDMSFETPNSPRVFTEQWDPSINVDLNTSANPLADSVYEVVLSVTVTAKQKDKTAFLVEVQQAGIFSIAGMNEAEVGHMLGSFCPNILFPYVREVVADLVNRGSFPQLNLAPVNFDALYAQQQQAEATAQ